MDTNQMNTSKISVVIPIYNTEKYLEECLSSVLLQTYSNLEILCIDDYSTDASAHIVKNYAAYDSRITLYKMKKNSGLSACRNFGILKSTGNFIFFLDSDDKILPTTLEDCISLIKKFKTEAVFINQEHFFPDGTRYSTMTGENYSPHDIVLDTSLHEICINFTNATCALFNASMIKEQSILFPEGRIYEDWIFMANFIMQSKNIYWHDVSLYKYRRNRYGSLTSYTTPKCLDMIKAYKEANTIIKDKNYLYQHINDIKIIDNGILFLKYNLYNASKDTIIEFIKMLSDIIHSFPPAYYLFIKTKCHILVKKDKLHIISLLRNKHYFVVICLLRAKSLRNFFKKNLNKFFARKSR